MHDVTIISTTEMLEEFEEALGYQLSEKDRLEVFHQLFLILNEHTPLDLDDRNILQYDSLLFANHLNVNHDAVDRIAYHLMVKLWPLLQAHGFYGSHGLDYFPFSMLGTDLCVRFYKN